MPHPGGLAMIVFVLDPNMPTSILTELRGGVLRVTLNRPEVHNAFDEGMVEGLRQAVERAAGEREIRSVLLAGAGPSFCSGAHIGWMKEQGSAGEDENHRSAERLARLFLEIDRLPKPVVGRIQGSVMGGGLGLTAACDVAIAASNARFSLGEMKLGIVPSLIVPYVIRKIGHGQTRELMLTGRRLTGEEAARIGLVGRAVEPSLLDAAVEATLSEILRGGPQALAEAKDLLRRLEAEALSGDDLVRITAEVFARLRAGDEARAGFSAFLEKTSPPWVSEAEGT